MGKIIKKLLLILLCFPMIGFGQFLYQLDSMTSSHGLLSKFYYDTQGKCVTELVEFPSIGYSVELTSTYDINDNLIELIQMNLSSISSPTNTKSIFSYDVNNNLTKIEKEHWNTASSQWDPFSETIFSYDINNYLILEETTYFVNIWPSKTKYSYQSGNLSLSITFEDSLSLGWDTISKSIYFYWTILAANLSSVQHYDYNNGFSFDYDDKYTINNSIQLSNTALPRHSVFLDYANDVDLFYYQPIQVITGRDPFTGSDSVSYFFHYSPWSGGSSGINENITNKQLVKTIDLLGRETRGKKNEPLFYIYDDGTVEKRITIE